MKRINKTRSSFNLPSLTLEGSLFLPDQLEKAALGKASAQKEADYQLPKGLQLRDEYSRSFQIASAQWKSFAKQQQRQDLDPHEITWQFVRELLRHAFGYHHIQYSKRILLGERSYPVNLQAGSLPVVVAPFTAGLDESLPQLAVEGSGSRKKSAFQLAQELLNASEQHLWALATNGRQIRLLRNADSLTRPSYLEVDLQDILQGQRFSEFASAWRLLHASRAPQPEHANNSCIWEQWRSDGQQEGTRVRDGLRHGVEQALLTLGQGFIEHPDNQVLRTALDDGSLSKDAYFQQLLRLVYRMIFVFTVEERGLLHPHDDSPAALQARQTYAEGYALGRLRDLCLKRRARNRFDDHWQAARIVFRGLQQGEPLLALPALGGLFAASQCPNLDSARLSNAHFLAVIQHLRWAHIDGSLSPVDYRNMGPEELGSVYESLLELVPSISLSSRRFGFVGLTEEGSTAGNARKLTGSYYTPDSLVQQLIKSALEPVIAQRLADHPDNPTAALLSIRVIDPACGSGHFLLAAARRLAEELAQLRSLSDGQEGAIKPQDYRHALREVISHCIFGVDRNPMAIELARMALWLEGFTEGRPLGFLDHRLQVGDALLGLTDLGALEYGISKDAFKPLSGDDRETCRELNKANTQALKQLEQQRKSPQFSLALEQNNSLTALQALEALPQDNLQHISAKQRAYQDFLQHSKNSPLHHAADLLVGAYLLEKTPDSQDKIPTTASLMLELMAQPDNHHAQHLQQRAAAQAACRAASVFHWPLAFPQVFAQGGFDCVLANPPWERIKLQEEEFFATRNADVAQAKNKAERSQRIQWLSEGMLAAHLHGLAHNISLEEQQLYREFIQARREAEASSVFAHVKGNDGGRYPLTGVGDVNTYALFAETILHITKNEQGFAGFIVPTGIATDASTQAYFGHISQTGRLVSLLDLENREAVFPGVHHSYKFCLLTLGQAEQAEFVFFATQVSQLADPRRRFSLTPEEFRLINPNTLTCPVFRSERDAELTKKLYRAAPVLIQEAVKSGSKVIQPEQNPWGIEFMRLLDMSNDSHLFKDQPGEHDLPLYEAKLIHHFDHRFATYDADGKTRDLTAAEKQDPDLGIQPRYWVARSEVEAKLKGKEWDRDWLMGWRDITNATNERTVIASVIPLAGVGNKIPLYLLGVKVTPQQSAVFLGNLSALVFDFVARQKIGGTTLNYFYMKQFPVLPPESYSQADLDFIVPRVLELTYTSHDLRGWARDLGYHGEPFTWNDKRRSQLRAELDAYYAKLYGLTRDELRYILDPADIMGDDYPSETFRVLKNKELKEFGEYRTQRLVLEAWDALQQPQPITVPTVKPTRRTVPLPVYAEGGTPASEAEDWLAGLICDVLLHAGACDDNRLRRILGARLPEGSPHAELLYEWLAPVNTERWPHICSWLRDLLSVAVTAPLSIRNPEALGSVIGDHRTESLARALIEARCQKEAALAEALSGSTPTAQTDELRKRG